jgi:SNF2 family DNA or RNA helicase
MIEKQDFIFKTTPMSHQKKAFDISRDKEAFALLMEQGTGKSKVIIDTAAWLYSQGLINCVVIVAPNGIHKNWIFREIPAHLLDVIQRDCHIMKTGGGGKDYELSLKKTTYSQNLKIFAINVEAFAYDNPIKIIKNILLFNNCLFVIDESSRIKSPKSKRTKELCKLGKYAKYRRILTGTPITQGPQDAYAQFKFLDQDILGFSSFTAFKNNFVSSTKVTRETSDGRKYNYDQITGYNNLSDLQKLIKDHSFRVEKHECLDLPEKIYQRFPVDLTSQQKKAYKELSDELLTIIKNEVVTAKIILTKLLRLHQIVGGFIPKGNEEEGILISDSNPKMDAVFELLEDFNGKCIIWARFKPEIKYIVKELQRVYGRESVVDYYGDTTSDKREEAVDRFQNDEKARFFVGNAKTGGIGLTLTAAEMMIYFSNDFSLETRLQSEDRAHRIGQKKNVVYVDIEATGTIDTKIINTLKSKKDVADFITGDEIRGWL